MRFLRIDLSNKLTDYGVKLIYKKIFDKDTEFDRAFFTDISTVRKLKMYYGMDSVESVYEDVSIPEYRYLQIRYFFRNLPDLQIDRITLEDGDDLILEITDQLITTSDYETSTSILTCVICRFVIDRNSNNPMSITGQDIRWNPVIITDYGIMYLYQSLANLRNEKVNFIYTGNGTPNNSPSNSQIVHILDDVRVNRVTYRDRYCLLYGRKPFNYSPTVLNEIGLGFYLTNRAYLRNYIPTMDRNWKGQMFPIDRSMSKNINTLEYDHPVLSLRLGENDYKCVWYSGKLGEPEETLFPNLSFSATFYVNVIYSILYDGELIRWSDISPSIPATLLLNDSISLIDPRLSQALSDSISVDDPYTLSQYTSKIYLGRASGSGNNYYEYGTITKLLNYNFDSNIYRVVEMSTYGDYIDLYWSYINKSSINSTSTVSGTIQYSTKNFLDLSTERLIVEVYQQSSGKYLTYYENGIDYTYSYHRTTSGNIITLSIEISLTPNSRVRTDVLANSGSYPVYFYLRCNQYNIKFSEGTDWTVTPYASDTTKSTFDFPRTGRLYHAYTTLYYTYEPIN